MDRGYEFHTGDGTAGSGADNGNILGITNYRDTSRSQAFTYDSLNRLNSGSSAANTGAYSWGENYSIDAWGNLQISPMSGKAHGGTFQLSGNVQNRPTGLAYDAAGSLTSYLSTTYTYDPENRLLSAAGITYTYDGNGERVLKSNTSTGIAVKRYWSMAGNTLAEGDGTGNLTAEYIYFDGKRVARVDLPANMVHYYLSDHLGSTSIVSSAAAASEEESDYYPFGTEVVITGPGTNELKFTGMRRDTESSLDDFGARYYGSALGRFVTADFADFMPIPVPWADLDNPATLNLYSYVQNNPLSNTDPDGHDCVVQTSTGPHTENVSISPGTCDKVKVGDGQTKSFIDGQVTSIKSNGVGGIAVGFTASSGATGIADFNAAPIPNNINLAYNWGNNAQGYRTLAQASTTVNAIAIATAAVTGLNGILIVAEPVGEYIAEKAGQQAYQRALQGWNGFKGTGQAQLINHFFKTGIIPAGLTPQAMAAYLALAKAVVAIGRGGLEGVAVQMQRIQMLEKTLENLGR